MWTVVWILVAALFVALMIWAMVGTSRKGGRSDAWMGGDGGLHGGG